MSDDAYTKQYPEPTAAPCAECPWRRVAAPGWLGPHDAWEWLEAIHGEGAIACHMTIKDTNDEGRGDWDHPSMRQCRGAAIFRAHVCKSPVNPSIETGPSDPDKVFVSNAEFVAHHTGEPMNEQEAAQVLIRRQLHGEEAA